MKKNKKIIILCILVFIISSYFVTKNNISKSTIVNNIDKNEELTLEENEITENVNSTSDICPLDIYLNNSSTFDYTGGEQTYTVYVSGTYKLEVWGAGSSSYGGYSVGYVDLNVGDVLYINVGGSGSSYSSTATSLNGGGYNGGGGGYRSGAGGGGATHIATKSGLLSTLSNSLNSILIVAGGSGGGDGIGTGYSITTGAGGGYIGNNGTATYNSSTSIYSYGGSQTAGGSSRGSTAIASGFGIGASDTYTDTTGYDSGGAGGGGYYGGGASRGSGPGAGGSGYIGNSLLTDKVMYCYNCSESSVASTKTVSTTCYSSTATSNCAKSGNGYAKITLVDV